MTPPTKRGVNFPADAPIGLGWLSITLRSHSENARGRLVGDVLRAIGENEPREREKGLKGYDEGLDVLQTSAVGWGAERPREVHLTLKQTDCSWPILRELLDVADRCESWRVSRLDLNYDDQKRLAELDDLVAANRARDVVTRAEVGRPGQVVCDGFGVPHSLYYGTMQSERVLNVYDKDRERASALRQPVAVGTYGVRWELRLKDDRAIAVLRELRAVGDVADLVAFFWRQVSGLVDFRAASGLVGHHNETRPRLGWWSRLVDEAIRAARYTRKVAEDPAWRLWRKERWLRDCAAAIAEVADAHPDPSFLREIVSIGAERNARKRDRVTLQLAAV